MSRCGEVGGFMFDSGAGYGEKVVLGLMNAGDSSQSESTGVIVGGGGGAGVCICVCVCVV